METIWLHDIFRSISSFHRHFREMLTLSTGYTEFVMENKNNQCLNINEID